MDVKKKMFNALKELIQVCPIETITVAEIVKKSGVSRTTFYRHYKDKYDLMNSYYKEYFESIYNNNYTFRNIYYLMVKFTGENKVFFNSAYKVSGQNSWQQFIAKHGYDYAKSVYKDKRDIPDISDEEKSLIYYNTAGGTYLTSKWIENENDYSAEDLTDLIFDLMPKEIKKYLDSNI